MNTTNNHSQNMSIKNLPNSEPSLQGNVVVGSSPPRGKEEKPILTIIIPTYNMEKYLRHCLDSLIVPNMDKVEVLVINDGSKDSSSAIGHEYQDKYPQTFRVIDKENGNYGSCVNRGLKEATGKYVKVLDADDSFNKDAFRSFIEYLCKIDVDLVLTDFCIVDEQDNITEKYVYSDWNNYIPVRKRFDFVDFINKPNINFNGQMHGITYRTEMFANMNYHQTEGVSYTDQEWVFKPMTYVKTCEYIDIQLYRYLVGRSGQTMKNVGKSIKQLIIVVFSMADFFISQDEKSVYRKYMIHQLEGQIDYIYRIGLLDRGFDLNILRDFDNKLESYQFLYQLVEKEGIIFSHPYFLQYIKYWRKHKCKKLPLLFILANKMKLTFKELH